LLLESFPSQRSDLRTTAGLPLAETKTAIVPEGVLVIKVIFVDEQAEIKQKK